MSKDSIIKAIVKVEYILLTKPETRNSDLLLMQEIWRFYHKDLINTVYETGREYVFMDDMNKLPSQDTVKRLRADFNSQNRYLPTDIEVVRQRRLNEDVWRDAMSKCKTYKFKTLNK